MRRHFRGRALLASAGVLNLLPAVAVLSVERACAAYGLDPVQGDMRLILRHRGLLFAILGAGLIVAVFRPRIRNAAIAAGMISMAGFVVMVPLEQPLGRPLLRVALLDLAGLVLLSAAAIAFRDREDADR